MAQSISRRPKVKRIQQINTQHGWLAAIAPLVCIGLAIAQYLPWASLTDAVSLALLGNLIGYCLRRFNP